MKLYIEEKNGAHKTGKNIYIDKIAYTKKELQELIGAKEFFINGEKYYVSQVKAEKSADNTTIGMMVGAVLGVIGGAFGVAIGTAIGGAIGKDNDIKDEEKVRKFNVY